MDPTTGPVRRWFVALLALGFLLGVTQAAVHVHALWPGDGAPSVGAGGGPHKLADAVCPVCIAQQVAGHGLMPAGAALVAPRRLPRLPVVDAAAAVVPAAFVAFRSRAPPVG